MEFALHSAVSSLERIEGLWEDCMDDVKVLCHAVEETCTFWILVFSEGPRAKSPWILKDDWTITSPALEEGSFPAFS